MLAPWPRAHRVEDLRGPREARPRDGPPPDRRPPVLWEGLGRPRRPPVGGRQEARGPSAAGASGVEALFEPQAVALRAVGLFPRGLEVRGDRIIVNCGRLLIVVIFIFLKILQIRILISSLISPNSLLNSLLILLILLIFSFKQSIQTTMHLQIANEWLTVCHRCVTSMSLMSVNQSDLMVHCALMRDLDSPLYRRRLLSKSVFFKWKFNLFK